MTMVTTLDQNTLGFVDHLNLAKGSESGNNYRRIAAPSSTCELHCDKVLIIFQKYIVNFVVYQMICVTMNRDTRCMQPYRSSESLYIPSNYHHVCQKHYEQRNGLPGILNTQDSLYLWQQVNVGGFLQM